MRTARTAMSTKLLRVAVVALEAHVGMFEAALAGEASAVSTFETTTAGAWRIEALVAATSDIGGLRTRVMIAAAALGVAPPEVIVEALPEADWLAENRKAFAPLRVGRFFIHGADARGRAPPGAIALQVEATTAFGTGRHETTRGCLIALDRLAGRRRVRRALDMGCGTGVLAIAAARIWGAPVVAVDLDPEAVRVARGNARVNGVADLVSVVRGDGYAAPPVARHAPYDLVTANLLARPLRAMAPDLAARLAPGGVAVLSGLLRGEAVAVTAAHRAQGLRPGDRIDRGDWTTWVIKFGAGD